MSAARKGEAVRRLGTWRALRAPVQTAAPSRLGQALRAGNWQLIALPEQEGEASLQGSEKLDRRWAPAGKGSRARGCGGPARSAAESEGIKSSKRPRSGFTFPAWLWRSSLCKGKKKGGGAYLGFCLFEQVWVPSTSRLAACKISIWFWTKK